MVFDIKHLLWTSQNHTPNSNYLSRSTRRKHRFLPYGHLAFESAVTAQIDEFNALFITRLRSYLRGLGQDTQYLVSILTEKLVRGICLNPKRTKAGLALEMKWNFISTFTKLHGHGDKRWPTEVTSSCVRTFSHLCPVYRLIYRLVLYPFSLPRVTNFKFRRQPHQKYYVAQYEDFSNLTQTKDDYTTSPHYIIYTVLFKMLGECTFSEYLGMNGLAASEQMSNNIPH